MTSQEVMDKLETVEAQVDKARRLGLDRETVRLFRQRAASLRKLLQQIETREEAR